MSLRGVTRNNLKNLDVNFPLRVFSCVTGISGSGKSSLVSQALVEFVGEALDARIAKAMNLPPVFMPRMWKGCRDSGRHTRAGNEGNGEQDGEVSESKTGINFQ